MDSNVRFMLDMLGYVLKGGTPPKEPENIDWEEVYRLSVSHGVAAMLAYGLMVNTYTIDKELNRRFMEKMVLSIAVDEKQRADCAEIFRGFEEQALDYLPLKGSVMKEVYPEPEMRQMTDVDILIRAEAYDAYRVVLEALGYTFQYESNHEWVFHRENSVAVELHKCLMPSYDGDLYAYYQKGWDIAKRKEKGSCLYFSHEDFYVYILAHFAKHYRDAGAGLKYIIDLWLYRRTYAMDLSYIHQRLEEMKLSTFAAHLDALMDLWFENGEEDALLLEMTDFIVVSGQYGTYENAGHARLLRMSPKEKKTTQKHKYLYLLFPNLETMKHKYPVLNRHPWSLPFFWLHRMVTWALFRRKNVHTHKQLLKNVSEEGMNTYRAHMEKVGLDIYNGRR